MAVAVPWERVEELPGIRSWGSVPAHSAPAPVSCHNRGCRCRCLVCGWCQRPPCHRRLGCRLPALTLDSSPKDRLCPGLGLPLGSCETFRSHELPRSLLVSSFLPGSGYYLESHTNEVYAEEPPPEPALDYRRGNSTQPILCVLVGQPRHGRLLRQLPALPQCPSGAPRSASTAERPPATPRGAAPTAAAWGRAAS